jgi:hypothetical protein
MIDQPESLLKFYDHSNEDMLKVVGTDSITYESS